MKTITGSFLGLVLGVGLLATLLIPSQQPINVVGTLDQHSTQISRHSTQIYYVVGFTPTPEGVTLTPILTPPLHHVRVVVGALNVRRCPATSCPVVDVLRYGQVVTVVSAIPLPGGSYTWFERVGAEGDGYLVSDFVQLMD